MVGLHRLKEMIPAPGSFRAQHLLLSCARESGGSGSQFSPGPCPLDRSRLSPLLGILWDWVVPWGSSRIWGPHTLLMGKGDWQGDASHILSPAPFKQPPQTLNDRNDSSSFDSTL